MNEEKLAYIKMIQDIITRMNHCSFLIKGWMITIFSAMLTIATSITNKGDKKQIIFCLVPVIIFWFLDAYYLWQERRFRCLYEEVINENDATLSNTLFDMNVTKCKKIQELKYKYVSSLFSKTTLPLYIVVAIFTVLITYLIKK